MNRMLRSFASFVAVFGLAGVAVLASGLGPTNVDTVRLGRTQLIDDSCQLGQCVGLPPSPSAKCAMAYDSILVSDGFTVRWTPTVSCNGYIPQGKTVQVRAIGQITASSTTRGFQVLDDFNRTLSMSAFDQTKTVSTGSYACDTTPGVITQLEGRGQAYSSAGNSPSSVETAWCN